MREPAPGAYSRPGPVFMVAALVMIMVVVELAPGWTGEGVAARVIGEAFLAVDALLPVVVESPAQISHVGADAPASQGNEVASNPVLGIAHHYPGWLACGRLVRLYHAQKLRSVIPDAGGRFAYCNHAGLVIQSAVVLVTGQGLAHPVTHQRGARIGGNLVLLIGPAASLWLLIHRPILLLLLIQLGHGDGHHAVERGVGPHQA